MTKKIIRFLLMIMVIIASSQLYGQQDSIVSLSLRQICQQGIEKNVYIRNAELDKLKSRSKVSETKSKLYPQLEGYSNLSYYFAIPRMVIPAEFFGGTPGTTMAVQIGTAFDWASGFKATQVIYNQSYFTSIRLTETMTALNELNFEQKKEEMVYQLTQIYNLIQTTRQQVKQLGKTMQNTDQLIKIGRSQSENGVIRKVDVSRLEVNKANLQTQIDNMNQLYVQQINLLKLLIGVDMTKKIELTDTLTVDLGESAKNLPNFHNTNTIRTIDKQKEIAILSLKAAKSEYFPTLAGFGQFYFEGQRNKFDYFKGGGDDKFYKVGIVGLSLTVPIFDGLEKHHKIQQQKIENQQLDNIRENTLNTMAKDYADALRQLDNCSTILERQQNNIKVAEEAYKINLDGYKQQVSTLSDVLMSESSLVEARLSYYNALMQLKNAQLDVKKASGTLLNY